MLEAHGTCSLRLTRGPVCAGLASPSAPLDCNATSDSNGKGVEGARLDGKELVLLRNLRRRHVQELRERSRRVPNGLIVAVVVCEGVLDALHFGARHRDRSDFQTARGADGGGVADKVALGQRLRKQTLQAHEALLTSAPAPGAASGCRARRRFASHD